MLSIRIVATRAALAAAVSSQASWAPRLKPRNRQRHPASRSNCCRSSSAPTRPQRRRATSRPSRQDASQTRGDKSHHGPLPANGPAITTVAAVPATDPPAEPALAFAEPMTNVVTVAGRVGPGGRAGRCQRHRPHRRYAGQAGAQKCRSCRCCGGPSPGGSRVFRIDRDVDVDIGATRQKFHERKRIMVGRGAGRTRRSHRRCVGRMVFDRFHAATPVWLTEHEFEGLRRAGIRPVGIYLLTQSRKKQVSRLTSFKST